MLKRCWRSPRYRERHSIFRRRSASSSSSSSWDSLAPGEIPVPDWQRDLIRERLAALEDLLPEERSVPWEAVRKRIFSDKT